MSDVNPEKVELKDLDPNRDDDYDDEDDEDETNFGDNDNLDQDNQDEDATTRVKPEQVLPNIPQTSEKQMIRLDKISKLRKFNIINLDPYAGPDTSSFLDQIEFTRDGRTKEREINGVKFNDQKVIFIDINNGEVRYYNGLSRPVLRAKEEFESWKERAKKENKKRVGGVIDDSAGVFVPPNVTENIVDRTINDVDDEKNYVFDFLQDLSPAVRKNLMDELNIDENVDRGLEENITRQLITALSPAVLNDDELNLVKQGGEEAKQLIADKIDGYKREKNRWLDLAKTEKEKAAQIDEQLKNQANTANETEKLQQDRDDHKQTALVYEKAADLCDLQADEIRLQVGLKPESERVQNILKANTERDPRTRLARFKKWAKENLGSLAAISISIAGIITTIVVAGRNVITKGARATSKFARGVYNVLKKLGPVFEVLGKVLFTVLSLGAQGLAFLANNLWILAVLVAYYLYDRYSRKSNK